MPLRHERTATSTALVLASLTISGCALLRDYDDYSMQSDSSSSGSSTGVGGSDAGTCEGVNLKADSENCGTCSHDCLGGDCLDGICQPITIFVNDPRSGGVGTFGDIAVSGGRLFWEDVGDLGQRSVVGGIWRARTDGSEANRLDPPQTTEPWAMVVSNTAVFWTAANGTVNRVDMAGGNVDKLASVSAPPRGLVVVDDGLYFAAQASIHRIDLMTVTDKEVAGPFASPFRLTADSTHVYFTVLGTSPRYLDGSLKRLALRGGAVEEVAQKQVLPGAIAIDDQNAYWALADGQIVRAPKSGEGSTELIFAPSDAADQNPQTLVIDGDDAIWTSWGSCLFAAGCGGEPLHGRVSRVPKTGGARMIVAEGQFLPTGLATDEQAIYWTTWWYTTVTRVAK
jgi:sugar lactone lactonase YvrE